MITTDPEFYSSDPLVIGNTKYVRLSHLSELLGQKVKVNVLGIVVTADEKNTGHFRISDLSRGYIAPISVQGNASDGKVLSGDCVLLRSFKVCNDSTGLPLLRKTANDDDQRSLCIWKVNDAMLQARQLGNELLVGEAVCADCKMSIGKEEMAEMIRLHNGFNKHKDPLIS
jgi:hypothetical protein